jgi:hypothetical protein
MIVNSLKVAIGFFLHLFGEQVGILRKYDGITCRTRNETKKSLLNGSLTLVSLRIQPSQSTD